MEQIETQVIEILRYLRNQLTWRLRSRFPFLHQYLKKCSYKWKTTGESFIQEHTDTVPICSFRYRITRPLFRRHIGRSAHNTEALVNSLRSNLCHQTEIKDY